VTTPRVAFDQLPTLVGAKTRGEPFTVTAEEQDRWDRACWIDRAYPDEDPDFPENIIEGFYALSLLDALARFAGLSDDESSWGLNYGLDRVRFVSKMYFGDRIIPEFEIVEVRPKGEGYLVLRRCSLTVEGAERPGVIADWWVYVLPRADRHTTAGVPNHEEESPR
jgi:carnitine-CoA ligase